MSMTANSETLRNKGVAIIVLGVVIAGTRFGEFVPDPSCDCDPALEFCWKLWSRRLPSSNSGSTGCHDHWLRCLASRSLF